MWFKNEDLANNIPSINGISQSPDEKACGEYNLSGVGQTLKSTITSDL